MSKQPCLQKTESKHCISKINEENHMIDQAFLTLPTSGAKHGWYRAQACVHLKLYMQVVFSCCTFFFLILLSPVTISKVIAGICILNMI